jgi:hypothetical protein
MAVLCPNTDDVERQALPGAGVDVRLSWAPEHMHLVRDSADGTAAGAQENPEPGSDPFIKGSDPSIDSQEATTT